MSLSKKIGISLASAAMALTGAVGTMAAAPTTAHAATTYVSYTVRAGDTLTTIASRYHTTVSAIASASGISNVNLIYVGQVLRIPQTTTTTTTTTRTPTTTTTTTTSGIVKTSYGAVYDPSKCKVSSAYWKGNRRFYLNTSTNYGCFTSPIFKGAHPVMLSFGKTAAPWYGSGGSHHGIDIDMAVGTPVYAKATGKVYVRPSTMGSAYGYYRMLIRSGSYDYAYGHMDRLTVSNGQYVKAGQLIGYSGMRGVENEDGPHLHFEVRPAGRGYLSAYNPWSFMGMKRI